MEPEVKTGVELSDFHVLQYINLLLSSLSSQPAQMDCVCVRAQLPWTWEKKYSGNNWFYTANLECYVDFLRFFHCMGRSLSDFELC